MQHWIKIIAFKHKQTKQQQTYKYGLVLIVSSHMLNAFYSFLLVYIINIQKKQ